MEVVTFPPPDRDALKHARDRALDDAPPLSASPPIRLEVVDEDGSAERHRPLPHHQPHRPRRPGLPPHPGHGGGAVRRPGQLPRRARPYAPPGAPRDRPVDTPSTWAPPARVAHGTPEPSPGNGLLVTELTVPRRPKGSPYTVNDQLMVTTALMIAHWNREHGARPRPLRITMPVDDRPRDADMPIGNGTRLVEVTFAPEELDRRRACRELLRRTALRTRALQVRATAPNSATAQPC